MASTKDITSVVTSNMRKHLAKQKWKVNWKYCQKSILSHFCQNCSFAVDKCIFYNIEDHTVSIIDRADQYSQSVTVADNEKCMILFWSSLNGQLLTIPREKTLMMNFSKRFTRPLSSVTCSGWKSIRPERGRVQIAHRQVLPRRSDRNTTHAFFNLLVPSNFNNCHNQHYCDLQLTNINKKHREEFFCSQKQKLQKLY